MKDVMTVAEAREVLGPISVEAARARLKVVINDNPIKTDPRRHQMYIDRLDQRMRYLTYRVAAKQEMKWEFEYDLSERDALAHVLSILSSVFVENVEPATTLTTEQVAQMHKNRKLNQ